MRPHQSIELEALVSTLKAAVHTTVIAAMHAHNQAERDVTNAWDKIDDLGSTPERVSRKLRAKNDELFLAGILDNLRRLRESL